jgi:hypothetical protein
MLSRQTRQCLSICLFICAGLTTISSYLISSSHLSLT